MFNYPGTPGDVVDLEDAFALEGLNADEGLTSLISAGDANGDGLEDFLVTNQSGQSYLLFGPVAQSSLFRATSSPVGPFHYTVEVRGADWSFDQQFANDDDGRAQYEALAPSVRAEGRASVIFRPGFGKAVGAGQLLGGDDIADLVFIGRRRR